MAGELGLESSLTRYVRFFVNGTSRDGVNGVMEDFVSPSGGLTGSWTGDPDPQVYKDYGWLGDPFGLYKDAFGRYKQSHYRWNLRKKQTVAPNDDYTGLYDLAEAFATTDEQLYTKRVQSLVDIRGWLSYFAINGALDNWDTYGWKYCHNMYAYIPVGRKSRMFIFDQDWSFQGSYNANPFPTDSVSWPVACRMVGTNQPAFRRVHWNVLKDMVDGPLKAERRAHLPQSRGAGAPEDS